MTALLVWIGYQGASPGLLPTKLHQTKRASMSRMYSNWPGGGELIASILAIGNAAPRFQMTNHRGAQGIDDNWMNMVTILCVLVVTFMLPAWPAFAQDVVLYDGPQVQIMPPTAVLAEVTFLQ